MGRLQGAGAPAPARRTAPMSRDVVVLVPDLMDRSRLGADPRVSFVRTVEEVLTDPPQVAFIDLGRCDDEQLERLSAAVPVIVGFGPHVDDERLAAATAAGFDDVMARSIFFRRFHELVERYAPNDATDVAGAD